MYPAFAPSLRNFIFCFSILISPTCFAQKDLDRNPIFFELAKKSIDYPRTATLSSLYGRVFAKFSVNQKGKIENIEVFYPKMTLNFESKVGFGANIKKGLKQLPLLGLGYEGTYILPVAFVFTNYGESSQPLYPTNTLPEFIETNNMTVLTEIKVFGKSNRYTKEDFKNGFQTTRPSQQIAQ
jgi:hypothetical protein